MVDWTGRLVEREMRWAVLSPSSRGHRTLDPANLLRSMEDLPNGRRAVRDWLDELADLCARQGSVTEVEMTAWRARFRGAQDPSHPSVRSYRVGRVAAAIAHAIPTAGPDLAAPRPLMYAVPSAVAGVPDRATGRPLTAAERQSALRRRRQAVADAVDRAPGLAARRAALVTPQPGDPGAITTARALARAARDGGSAADLAGALRGLYEVLNDQERREASTAARWSAEMSPRRSLAAYEMYNADLGVLVRHRELALTGQVALAMDTMRLARRTIDTASLSPEGSALLEIRHVERVAHTLVTRREVRGEILRSRDVQTSDRQVRQLTRLVLEGRLEGVDPGWLAVVLQRRIELALLQLDPNVVPGSVMQARDPVSDLRLAERQAGEVIRDLGGILPGLRLAQLHRLRAEAGRRLHDWELAERSLRLGLRHARGLPGQLAKLAKVNGGLPPGIRLDLP